MKKIIVGSQSAHKLNAVVQVCKSLGLKDAVVTGEKTNSGQNEQPIGIQETISGALARAKQVQRNNADAICIGIENGIIRTGKPLDISLDLAVIVVLYKELQIITNSSGIQIPESFVDTAEQRGAKDVTAGSIIAITCGGDKTDPYSILTKGAVTRCNILISGLEIAFKQLPQII